MFTGIVEEVGQVSLVSYGSKAVNIRVKCSVALSDLKQGDSISVNGVCLTVTGIFPDSFSADIVKETLARSTFKTMKIGDPVNIERAMRADSRFGGHVVNGHVDGVGRISAIRSGVRSIEVEITCDRQFKSKLIEKGSITVDGVSLTVASLSQRGFKTAIVPFTMKNTIFSRKKIGDFVNLELDAMGKYVEKYLHNSSQPEKIDEEFLKEAGHKL